MMTNIKFYVANVWSYILVLKLVEFKIRLSCILEHKSSFL